MLRPFVEKLVTKLKDPSVHNIRYGIAQLANRGIVLSIAQEVSPAFKDRNGGYLRIMKLAQRRPGDCADMALIEWVDESLVKSQVVSAPTIKKVKKATSAKPAKVKKAVSGEAKENKPAKKKKAAVS
jgi:large subunit ribosomal protein L17